MSLCLFGDIKQQILVVNKNLLKMQKKFTLSLFLSNEHPGREIWLKKKQMITVI
jgi:hypothetical protein